MAIYVDQLRDWTPFDYGKDGEWCHMSTDLDDLTELHEMALRIGLKRKWFQNHSLHPHYDLTPTKRGLAIRNGATSVSNKEFVLKVSKLFKHKRDQQADAG